MAEPFVGEIRMVGFTFAPRGWAFCAGQLMSISQNEALFALLGTTYGGDGIVTFGLPDMRGRVPIHQGQGPGLTPRVLGEISGEENHTLIVTEIASHTHAVTVSPKCSADDGSTGSPVGNVPAVPAAGATPVTAYTSSGTETMASGSGTSTPTGGSQPHDNMQPFLVANFIIALEGIFPSRN
jgi:microcystin-dependent protein